MRPFKKLSDKQLSLKMKGYCKRVEDYENGSEEYQKLMDQRHCGMYLANINDVRTDLLMEYRERE